MFLFRSFVCFHSLCISLIKPTKYYVTTMLKDVVNMTFSMLLCCAYGAKHNLRVRVPL